MLHCITRNFVIYTRHLMLSRRWNEDCDGFGM